MIAKAGRLRAWQMLFVVFACYLGGRLGLALTSFGTGVDTGVAVLWPLAGIALAVLLRRGLAMWPAVLAGAFLLAWSTGASVLIAALLALGNTLGPALAAVILQRAGLHFELDRRRDLWLYGSIGIGLSALVSAGNAAFWLAATGAIDAALLPRVWLTRSLGDALGVLVVGIPLLTLSWAALRRAFGQWRGVPTGLIAASALASALVYDASLSGPGGHATDAAQAVASLLLFMPHLLLCWLAVRSGLFAASATALLLAGATSFAAAHGIGPFPHSDSSQGAAALVAYACSLFAFPLLTTALTGEIAARERHWKLALETADIGVGDWDLARGRITLSPRWLGLIGHSTQSFGDSFAAFWALVHPDDLAALQSALEPLRSGSASGARVECLVPCRLPCRLKCRLKCLDGAWRPFELHALIAERDGSGKPTRLLATARDITEVQAASERHDLLQLEQLEQLGRKAHFDELTRLPNRVRLSQMLLTAMQTSRRDGSLLTVCYLDLDHFKPVNDRFGHAAGDRLLIELAERMRRSLRSWAAGDDVVARIGGDEFVLLLRTATLEESRHAVERVLNQLSQPYALGEEAGPVAVTASIGATVFPLDGADADTLLRHADHAMYGAKQAGRNGYLFFDAEHDRRAEARFVALGRVQEALDAEELRLFFQPKVDMRSGKVVGVEALLRWKHPEHGVISPAQFLPLIENTGLSISVGNWVLQHGIAQLARWLHMGLDITVSINVSARHLQEPLFGQHLAGLLARQHAPVAHRLILEVLETAALADIDYTCTLLEECRALGVRFALDDFGTGYSTFTYLKRLPIDMLKIDRSFVINMLADRQDLAIVEGVIGLSQTFGCAVVAEGVETAAQAQRLIEIGCHVGQGNGIAAAMPPELLPDWIAAYKGMPNDAELVAF